MSSSSSSPSPCSPSDPAHSRAVSAISARVRHFSASATPFRLYHGSTNSTRRSSRASDAIIDTSALTRILHLSSRSPASPENDYVLVEPNVSMSALTSATLAHALVPPVVMEFPRITCGGGFAGTSGESSSFRHGTFERSVVGIEIVLGSGTVMWATERNEHARILDAARGSFGTLGVVTALAVRLVPAKRWVRLEYWPVGGTGEAVALMRKADREGEAEFIDGIMYASTRGTVCLGRMVDEDHAPAGWKGGGRRVGFPVQRFMRARDPWFYLHAERVSRLPRELVHDGEKEVELAPPPQPQPSHTELVPIRDYLFRYDRGGFWVGRYAWRYFRVPFNRVTRWALDPLTHVAVMYRALHNSGLIERYVVQDVGVPLGEAEGFAAFLEGEFGHWPVWLCPVRQERESGSALRLRAREEGMLLNFGVWGPGPTDRGEAVGVNRRLEAEVRRRGGLKCLYAEAYYTEEEFWGIYDRTHFEALRKETGAGYLPGAWEKVGRQREERGGAERGVRARLTEVWPVRGVYGVVAAMVGRGGLLSRRRRSSSSSGER